MEGMTGVALKAARLLSFLSSTSRVSDNVLNCRVNLQVRRIGVIILNGLLSVEDLNRQNLGGCDDSCTPTLISMGLLETVGNDRYEGERCAEFRLRHRFETAAALINVACQ